MKLMASGSPRYWIKGGRVRAPSKRPIASTNIKTTGVCCHKARLAVDHTEVQKQRMAVEPRAR